MASTYHCPRCSGLLNPGTKVIFILEQGPNRGLLLLSPDLGDYAVVLAESFPIQAGTLHTFRCPICRGDLTSPGNDKLVEILCSQHDGADVRVAFSRVAGEHATFICGPRGVSSFGEHAGRYEGMNFFGAGDNDPLTGS